MIELRLDQAENLVKALESFFGQAFFSLTPDLGPKHLAGVLEHGKVLKALVDKKKKAYEDAETFYHIYIEENGDDDGLDEFLQEEFGFLHEENDDAGNEDPIDELAILIEYRGSKEIAHRMSITFELDFSTKENKNEG